jgi:hypothetical protein
MGTMKNSRRHGANLLARPDSGHTRPLDIGTLINSPARPRNPLPAITRA